jgi:integrase
MINRKNWKFVKKYLVYRKDVDQLVQESLRLEESRLYHLLRWADDQYFSKAPKIRPTFPKYLLSARIDGENMLSPIYIQKMIRTAYNFFRWLKVNNSDFEKINQSWLDTLKPSRMTIEHREHEFVTMDEIKAIAQAPAATLRERRIKAASIFWFLSGIRVGAFVTLPISAIDFNNLSVKQWPKLGVKTKFKKHATTFILNIPALIEVVQEWDKEVRAVLPKNGLWFASALPKTGEIDPGITIKNVGKNRKSRANRDLKEWLAKVGLPYHSPHKFRHGFAVYALKKAKDIIALKAVSQNLMHTNLSITDGVYGMLSATDIQEQISLLGLIDEAQSENTDSIIPLLEQLLLQLKSK